MKISLVKSPTEEDWMLVKKLALATCDKKVVTPPSYEWKERILIARHSPIRELKFIFKLEDIPYWVSVHLVRHVHAQPYVKSQRNDRQKVDDPNYDRTKAPQDAPIPMYWSMGAEELMTIANKRLCTLASKETREVVRQMCVLVAKEYPEFKSSLVPACIANGFCKEMNSCGLRPHITTTNIKYELGGIDEE